MSPKASGTTTSEKVFMAVVVGLVLGALALTAYPSLNVVPVARKAQPEAPAQPVHAAPLTETRPAPHAAPVDEDAPNYVPQRTVEKPKASVKSTFVWPPPSLRSSSAASGSETDALGRTVSAPAVASTTTSAAGEAVTVSGCLEATVDGAEFRLTDTDGADAPKARNWRSGFLKKRSAPVELVELSDPVGLRKYVGHRVTATGVLTGRELRVGSLQASGTSCE
jgi:hypothetical protein